MITEKNHKLLISQLFVTDCTKKGLASLLLFLACFTSWLNFNKYFLIPTIHFMHENFYQFLFDGH
jgi:hypothetical protein